MTANGRSKDTKKKKKMCTQASDLKERLESCVQRLENQNPHIQTIAVDELRNLAREITEECEERKLSSSQQSEEADLDDLKILVAQVVPFYMKHNAEVEAVDLVTEVEDFDLLIDNVNIRNYKRTTMYLTCLARYLPVPDNTVALHVARAIYLKYDDHPSALRISLCLNHLEYVKQLFEKCEDVSQKKQFCYMLARHGTNVLLDEKMVADDDERAEMQQIIRNSKLRGGYLDLAHETEVRDPKSPEEIFEAQLINGWENGGARTEIARQNLAATFVNAFVNAGFGRDMLIIVPPEGPSGASTEDWILLNKNHEQTSAAASLGMILLWDVDGLPQFDRYLLKGNYLTAGVLLGHGILNAAISDDFDPASLLAHYARLEDLVPRIGAIMGLGIAYAGSRDVQILEMFMPILGDSCTQHAVIAFIAVSLGLIFVGSSNEIIAGLLISRLADLTEDELSEPLTRFAVLGLGLLFLGKQGHIGATATDCKHFSEKIKKYSGVILTSCAYAGTGDVNEVQNLLRQCTEHLEDATHQGAAVLGIAMVAGAEDLDIDMAIRSMERLLQYGEQNIRRAVPLALGLLCISNPKVNVMDTLSELAHDPEQNVSMAAIISLGLIGAGTNNGRIIGMLHKLSSYYCNDSSLLFCVQIAQGLVHLGQGLLTLDPYYSERFLLSRTGLAGIITLLHACLDFRYFILGEYHYVLYFIVLAMQPRMLMTVGEDLKPLSVPVRVGRAVDIVGLPGLSKNITGYRTQSTPILLAAGERAELANEKYIPLTPILEGFVILRTNPDYSDDQ